MGCKMSSIHFVIAVTARELEEEFLDCMRRIGVQVTFSSLGHGTVEPGILELLGLQKTEKSVLFSICSRHCAHRALRALTEQIGLRAPGRGIALTLPVTSLDRHLAAHLTEGQPTPRQEESSMNLPYELIVAIVDKDTSDLVMSAARAAGAPGGTVIHAKGTEAGQAHKFFGISLAEEREIVFIVIPAADRAPVMRSIARLAGPESEIHAILFSLPVSQAAGLRLPGEEEAL